MLDESVSQCVSVTISNVWRDIANLNNTGNRLTKAQWLVWSIFYPLIIADGSQGEQAQPRRGGEAQLTNTAEAQAKTRESSQCPSSTRDRRSQSQAIQTKDREDNKSESGQTKPRERIDVYVSDVRGDSKGTQREVVMWCNFI